MADANVVDMRLQHILVVDDKLSSETKEEDGIRITIVNSRKDALTVLRDRNPVDLLILDWILEEPENSTQAQLLLLDLADIRFIPVLIWSNNETKFRNECPEEFPKVAYECVEKLPYSELIAKARDYFQTSLAGKLASPWRTAVHQALEQSLYDLARAQSSDLRDFLWSEENEDRPVNAVNQLLSHALHQDPVIREALEDVELDGEPVTAEDAVSKLQAVLSNRLTAGEFRDVLIGSLRAIQEAAVGQGTTAFDELVHNEMYYVIADSDTRVRSGDIVELQIGESQFLGLVLTPACDMRKTRFLRIVILMEEESAVPKAKDRMQVRKETVFGMATLFALKDYQHYVANFHDLVVLHVPPAENNENEHLWQTKVPFGRLTYDLTYQTRTGEPVTLRRMCRLADPYRSDIIQRFASHASRIGIPELRYRND